MNALLTELEENFTLPPLEIDCFVISRAYLDPLRCTEYNLLLLDNPGGEAGSETRAPQKPHFSRECFILEKKGCLSLLTS